MVNISKQILAFLSLQESLRVIPNDAFFDRFTFTVSGRPVLVGPVSFRTHLKDSIVSLTSLTIDSLVEPSKRLSATKHRSTGKHHMGLGDEHSTGHMNTGNMGHGDTGTLEHGTQDTGTQEHRNTGTQEHRDRDMVT